MEQSCWKSKWLSLPPPYEIIWMSVWVIWICWLCGFTSSSAFCHNVKTKSKRSSPVSANICMYIYIYSNGQRSRQETEKERGEWPSLCSNLSPTRHPRKLVQLKWKTNNRKTSKELNKYSPLQMHHWPFYQQFTVTLVVSSSRKHSGLSGVKHTNTQTHSNAQHLFWDRRIITKCDVCYIWGAQYLVVCSFS